MYISIYIWIECLFECCIAITTIHTYIHAESLRRHNKDERHSSSEKYTSHFIWKGSKGLLKVLLCETWVGNWTEMQLIDPHSYGHNSVSFPFFWAAQPGPGVHPLWDMVLIPSSSLHMIWTPTAQPGVLKTPLLSAGSLYSILSPTNSNFLCTELYYCFTPTQFNLSTVKVIPLIPSTGSTCYLYRCISYFNSLAGSEFNIQHEE